LCDFFTGSLHKLIENSVIDEKDDTRMPKKSWKERVEATECAWKEAFQTLLEDVFATQAFHCLPLKNVVCNSQHMLFDVAVAICFVVEIVT
jgi:hypothetical protein